MNDKQDSFDVFDPTGMFKEIRNANMDTWAKMMGEAVSTEAYSEATGAMLDTWLSSSGPFRKALETSMTQVMTNLNIPVRDDITRLAERLTNIEMRLDDLDAKLDEKLQ